MPDVAVIAAAPNAQPARMTVPKPLGSLTQTRARLNTEHSRDGRRIRILSSAAAPAANTALMPTATEKCKNRCDDFA